MAESAQEAEVDVAEEQRRIDSALDAGLPDSDLVEPGHWARVRARLLAIPRRTDFADGDEPEPLT